MKKKHDWCAFTHFPDSSELDIRGSLTGKVSFSSLMDSGRSNCPSHFPHVNISSSPRTFHCFGGPQNVLCLEVSRVLLFCSDCGHTEIQGLGQNFECPAIAVIEKWKPEFFSLLCFYIRIIRYLRFQPLLLFCPASSFPGSPNPPGRQTNETPQTQKEEDLQITGTTPPRTVFIQGTCTDVSIYRYWYSHCYINTYTMAESSHHHRVLTETWYSIFLVRKGNECWKKQSKSLNIESDKWARDY